MKLAHKNRITANHHTNPNSLILRDLILKEKYLLKDPPNVLTTFFVIGVDTTLIKTSHLLFHLSI